MEKLSGSQVLEGNWFVIEPGGFTNVSSIDSSFYMVNSDDMQLFYQGKDGKLSSVDDFVTMNELCTEFVETVCASTSIEFDIVENSWFEVVPHLMSNVGYNQKYKGQTWDEITTCFRGGTETAAIGYTTLYKLLDCLGLIFCLEELWSMIWVQCIDLNSKKFTLISVDLLNQVKNSHWLSYFSLSDFKFQMVAACVILNVVKCPIDEMSFNYGFGNEEGLKKIVEFISEFHRHTIGFNPANQFYDGGYILFVWICLFLRGWGSHLRTASEVFKTLKHSKILMVFNNDLSQVRFFSSQHVLNLNVIGDEAIFVSCGKMNINAETLLLDKFVPVRSKALWCFKEFEWKELITSNVNELPKSWDGIVTEFKGGTAFCISPFLQFQFAAFNHFGQKVRIHVYECISSLSCIGWFSEVNFLIEVETFQFSCLEDNGACRVKRSVISFLQVLNALDIEYLIRKILCYVLEFDIDKNLVVAVLNGSSEFLNLVNECRELWYPSCFSTVLEDVETLFESLDIQSLLGVSGFSFLFGTSVSKMTSSEIPSLLCIYSWFAGRVVDLPSNQTGLQKLVGQKNITDPKFMHWCQYFSVFCTKSSVLEYKIRSFATIENMSMECSSYGAYISNRFAMAGPRMSLSLKSNALQLILLLLAQLFCGVEQLLEFLIQVIQYSIMWVAAFQNMLELRWHKRWSKREFQRLKFVPELVEAGNVVKYEMVLMNAPFCLIFLIAWQNVIVLQEAVRILASTLLISIKWLISDPCRNVGDLWHFVHIDGSLFPYAYQFIEPFSFKYKVDNYTLVWNKETGFISEGSWSAFEAYTILEFGYSSVKRIHRAWDKMVTTFRGGTHFGLANQFSIGTEELSIDPLSLYFTVQLISMFRKLFPSLNHLYYLLLATINANLEDKIYFKGKGLSCP